MDIVRREFFKLAGSGIAGAAVSNGMAAASPAQDARMHGDLATGTYNVRFYGAKGDGTTIDTPAINRAIGSAAENGGGTVYFPAGTYACYSIRLKSNVSLCLDQGATILAAAVPEGGSTSGNYYDAAESNQPWEAYQDYGHNHWHNSLIWGENIQDISIFGPGLIWGKGLSRGARELPHAETPGMGNKSIALKNCHNVILRDFSILQGGHFGILATGVDNLTIDNLKIDTNRDGMDIDCCRNVRISNCSVNSPWDDAICPKSSFALGHARTTENVTISNCYVTGAYELGSMLDGTWKRWPAGAKVSRTGRIKCGTESNGGFKNIAISNCVFDGCGGFALESVDGARLEDVTFSGITMRDCSNTPLFLRLGSRMRGPAGIPIGVLKRIVISNVVSYNSASRYGGAGLISGIPGNPIQDVMIDNIYMEYLGAGTASDHVPIPPENANGYPEPSMFGTVPASGFFIRNVKNIALSNVELAWSGQDSRPVFWLGNVDGAEIFHARVPKNAVSPVLSLHDVEDITVMVSRNLKDVHLDKVDEQNL
jgi:polygalacturonase